MSTSRVQVAEAYTPLYEPHRYKVYWGGRGAAKSWAFADALLVQGIQNPLRILCTRELQKSIKDSVHTLLSDRIEALGLEAEYEVLDKVIRGRRGSEFIFTGLRYNVREIKSIEGVDRCWVEEAESVSDESWRVLLPTVRKEGSEIWVSFNNRLKSDATYQRFVVEPPPDAYVRKVSWRDNPWFPDVLRREMEHDKETDYEEYQYIWEGEFKMFADGAIYGKQLKKAREEGRICRLPIQTACEVNTFWDLGKNDTTAIWFHQRVGPENRFIDYYENRLVDLDHYIRVLKDKGYLYGAHYLPHDVEFDMLGMTETRREQLERGGVKPISVVPRIPNISEGIEMVRNQFASCWFDEERCEQGLSALSNYQYIYDEEYNTFRQRPAHTWASNGADAFRQFAQGYRHGAGWAGLMKDESKKTYKRPTRNRFKTDASWRV